MTLAPAVRRRHSGMPPTPRELADPGEVFLSASTAEIRLPRTTRHVRAAILGVQPEPLHNADGARHTFETAPGVRIYLDRLVHTGAHASVGAYALRGAASTILIGPRPRTPAAEPVA